MKKLGYADRTWTLKEAIKKQIEIENRVVFSQQPVSVIKDYRPMKLKLTEAAKAGLAGSIHFITSLPKL